MLSPGGLPEVPCAKCGRRVRGLPWGDLCPECRAARAKRASKLGNRVALAATALMAAYVAWRVPSDPNARFYGAVAIVATYIIVRRIASRVAMEFLPQ
jgi:hypothetical protein